MKLLGVLVWVCVAPAIKSSELSAAVNETATARSDGELTPAEVAAPESSVIPVKVFLSLRNITNEAALNNFRDRNDLMDLQGSASDSVVSNVTRLDEGTEKTLSPRNSRDTQDSASSSTDALFTKYKKIDTAELSDCALQGDWHPIGGPGHHHLQQTVVAPPPHYHHLQQSIGVPPVSHHYLPSPQAESLPQQHHGTWGGPPPHDAYHVQSQVHSQVQSHEQSHVQSHGPRGKASDDLYLSPPPLPQRLYAEKPFRSKPKLKRPKPFIQASISEVPVSVAYSYHAPSQEDLGSFTCGKNHEQGTNFHTAHFQVAEDEPPSLNGIHGQFTSETHAQNVAIPYPQELHYQQQQQQQQPPPPPPQQQQHPYTAESRQNLEEDLAVSFPTSDTHDLQEVEIPVDSSQAESQHVSAPASSPYNPWNEQFEPTTQLPTTAAAAAVAEGPQQPQQQQQQQVDQVPEPNAHSYYYEVENLSKYPKPSSHFETSFQDGQAYTREQSQQPYNSLSTDHDQIIKELEQFSNDLNNKYEQARLPPQGFGAVDGSTGSQYHDSAGEFPEHHTEYHGGHNQYLANQNNAHGSHDDATTRSPFHSEFDGFQEHGNQFHDGHNHYEDHQHQVPHYEGQYLPEDHGQQHQDVHLPAYKPSLEYKIPYTPPVAPHSSAYEPPSHLLHPQPLHHRDHEPLLHHDHGPVFHHDGHTSVNLNDLHSSVKPSLTPQDDHYHRKVNHVDLKYVTQMEYHGNQHPVLTNHPESYHRFRYTVHHHEPAIQPSTPFPETQPVFSKEPIRLTPPNIHQPHVGSFPRGPEAHYPHGDGLANKYTGGLHLKVRTPPKPYPHHGFNFKLPISALDIDTPKHDRPKVHKPPKRKHPTKQYEVHENSGEKHRPLAEIFPPQKMPKQFNTRTPNFAVNRPKKGKKPTKAGGFFSESSEFKTILQPPVKSKRVQRQKDSGTKVVKYTALEKLGSSGGVQTDKTVKVNSSLDPTKKQVLARVVEFSGR